jgi:hypothetical protein
MKFLQIVADIFRERKVNKALFLFYSEGLLRSP